MIWNNLKKLLYRYTLLTGLTYATPSLPKNTKQEAVADPTIIVSYDNRIYNLTSSNIYSQSSQEFFTRFITTDFEANLAEETDFTDSNIASTTNNYTYSADNYTITITSGYTNNTESNVTLYGYFVIRMLLTSMSSSIGSSGWSTSANRAVPFASIKFDSPVTIEPGQSMSISYTIDFSDILNPQETSSIN